MKIHKRSTPETRRRLSLNTGLLLVTLFILGISALVIWGVHSLQMSRVASSLISQAQQAKEESNWPIAAKLTENYLLLWPSDSERKVELAEVYDKSATSVPQIQRLIGLQSIAIGACESKQELQGRIEPIRRRMIERLMQLGRQDEAMYEIARIAGSKLDLELAKRFALCRYQLLVEKRPDKLPIGALSQLPPWLVSLESMKIPDLLARVLSDMPGDIELSVSLAECLLGDSELLDGSPTFPKDNRTELKDRALNYMDRMLAANREDPEAWLAHYMISSRIDRAAAETDIRQVLALAPNDINVLKQAGMHYLERARSFAGFNNKEQRKAWLDESQAYFQKVRESDKSNDVATFLGYGEVLKEQGKTNEAIMVWRDGSRVCEPPTMILRFRIVEAYIESKRYQNALVALDEMDEAISDEGPLLPKLFQNAYARDSKRLWSSYYVAIGDYRSATALLQQVVDGNRELERPDQAEIFGFLASAYFKMGQWDQSAYNFEHAINLAPSNASYERGAANAWFAARRFSEALKHLQSIEYKKAMDWVQLAEVILEIQKLQRPDPALWVMFDRALIDARRMTVNDDGLTSSPWILEYLAIEAMPYRGTEEDSAETLATVATEIQKLCTKYPEADDLWRRAIGRLRNWKQDEVARQLLEKLRERAKESTEATIAQAEALAQDGFASEGRLLLEERLIVDPKNELLKKVIVQWTAQSDLGGALEKMKVGGFKDINVVRALAEVAIRSPVLERELDLGNRRLVEDRLKKWSQNLEIIEREMYDLEGDKGTEWRFLRGKRLLVSNALTKNFDTTEVAEIVSFLDNNRPLWTSTHVLIGNLAERQANPGRAVKAYGRAIQYGEQSLEVYERLAELLYRQGALADVGTLIEKLGQRASRSRDLSQKMINLARDSKSEMLEFAKEGTVVRPNDPMAWVWYAQSIEVNSREELNPEKRKDAIKEAERGFARANELAESADIRVLGAELTFYKAIGDDERVAELVADIRANDKIDPAIKWMAIASISQSLGIMDDAAEAYDEALKAGGDKIEIGRRVAQLLLLQGKQDEAIERLRTVLAEDTKDPETKRSLASLLANRGTQDDWKDIERLLTNERGNSSADDRRLQAELLLQKGGPAEMAQAQYLLEGLVEDPSNRTDEDRFRLASVYLRNARLIAERSGEQSQVRQLIQSAGRELKQATLGNQAPPEYIYAYGDFLLEQEQFDEAKKQSERLSLAAPDAFSTALLKARVQAAYDKPEDAKSIILAWLESRKLVKGLSRDPSGIAQILVQAGQALDLLGYITDAEKLLREAFELDPRAGDNYVQSLARSKDEVARNQAIRYLVEKVKKDKATGTARLLANLLASGKFDQELQREGEETLSSIESSNDGDADLLLAVADMWLAQNKTERAIETYRKIVRLRPSVVALNNLANLLAEQPGGGEEALVHIDQALAMAGRQPLLLDTKGVILMMNERVEEAIPLFEIATAGSPDPRLLLHLYISLLKAGRNEEATRARSKINMDELSRSLLTPLDRDELRKLQGETL
jgi:tetratricopeptide (TPR) repeat protein